MFRTMNTAAVAFASLALTTGMVAFADPANANVAPAHEIARQVSVHTGDLDLNSDAGRSEAKHRIRQAVTEVCGFGEFGDRVVSACRNTATVAARQQLDARIAAL